MRPSGSSSEGWQAHSKSAAPANLCCRKSMLRQRLALLVSWMKVETHSILRSSLILQMNQLLSVTCRNKRRKSRSRSCPNTIAPSSSLVTKVASNWTKTSKSSNSPPNRKQSSRIQTWIWTVTILLTCSAAQLLFCNPRRRRPRLKMTIVPAFVESQAGFSTGDRFRRFS